MNETWKKLEHITEILGAETTLEALASALGTSILDEHLDYIIRQYDLKNEEDDEDWMYD